MGDDTTNLDKTIREREDIKDVIAGLTKRLDQLTTIIKVEMGKLGTDLYTGDVFSAKLVHRSRRTLDRTKLLELGVSADTLDEGTKTTTYDSLTVTRNKLSKESV